jgi:hypothetical protein
MRQGRCMHARYTYVERTCAFIQEKDGRVLEYAPRDCHSVYVCVCVCVCVRVNNSVFLSLLQTHLCFSPPLNFRPRSPTAMLNPCGCASMKGRSCADSTAFSTSEKVALREPYRRLFKRVSLKRDVSCGTTPMALRTERCLNFLMSSLWM